MDVRYINPFIKGTLEVLKTMAFIEPVAGKPFVKNTFAAVGDVSAIIGITGDVVGSLAISFSEPCICAIISNMLGETFPEVNKEVFDGAGEITNMVSGVARSQMEKEGLTAYAAIPTVIYGKGHSVLHILKAPSIVVPFSSQKGDFVIDVCIKTIEAGAKKEQDYRVLNVRTSDMVRPEAKPSATVAPGRQTTALPEKQTETDRETVGVRELKTYEEKIEFLKEKLAELVGKREEIQKEMQANPFMPIDRRKKFKKEIAFYDEKIRRLKLDLRAVELLAKLPEDQANGENIPVHFQDHQSK